jgi:SAM-dependent methyltransferase
MLFQYKSCPACSGTPKNNQLVIRSKSFSICSNCGTLWLTEGPKYEDYDDQYIKMRGHNEISSVIDYAKMSTFRSLWRKLGQIKGPVLEVGFSTGASLKVAQDMGIDIYGLEVNKSIIEFVEKRGIPRKKISVNGLKKFLNKKFNAVAFFDSFEHLPDPQKFLSELRPYLADGAAILIVIPNGGAISRKLLGRFWPHYVTDHWVHYTVKGLRILLNNFNIKIDKTFFPLKYVPIEMIVRHIIIHWHIPINWINKFKWILSIKLRFNIGEVGLMCKYDISEKIKD